MCHILAGAIRALPHRVLCGPLLNYLRCVSTKSLLQDYVRLLFCKKLKSTCQWLAIELLFNCPILWYSARVLFSKKTFKLLDKRDKN